MATLGMRIIEKRVSPINGRITVARSLGLGTYIQIEGLTQSGGIVESIWKSTLKKVHRSLITNHRTLILGLGGGTAVKVVKKLWSEAEITGVEIDPIMIELGRKYLNLNLNLNSIYIGDAERSIRRTRMKYDLILVDVYLGEVFPEKFEDFDFLARLSRKIKTGGIIVFNRLYYGEKRSEAVRFGEKLKKVFPKVEYLYPQANLMFLCST